MYKSITKLQVYFFSVTQILIVMSRKTKKQKNKKQDMTVPFARARAKLGGSIR